jgi:1,5-anhydro-D-fructose reductase (1,5-anhydro-D-mannitol-forming)
MKRIGIVGFGFMGNMHFNKYREIDGAKVAAICDIVEQKLTGKYGATGNIAGTGQKLDLTDIAVFNDADKMFKEADLDAVSITLPTYLHKEYTIKALRAGLHVLCEKPMALNSADCQAMIEAAEKCGKILQVGHCIRFWPEYAKAKELVDSGQYGKLKAATFHRLSLKPVWVWDNWLLDAQRSGGALLDLHIHDADFIQYLFGMPDFVSTRAIKGPSGGYDHAVTQYIYDGEMVITAECGWIMTNSFGFQMSFEMILEKAVICYDCKKTPTCKVYPDSGEAFTPEIESGNGYLLEMKHFVNAVSGRSVPDIITPTQSLQSVKLIEMEKKSADSSEKVQI